MLELQRMLCHRQPYNCEFSINSVDVACAPPRYLQIDNIENTTMLSSCKVMFVRSFIPSKQKNSM